VMEDITKNIEGKRFPGRENHPHPTAERTIQMCRIKPKRIMTDARKAAAISPADATPGSTIGSPRLGAGGSLGGQKNRFRCVSATGRLLLWTPAPGFRMSANGDWTPSLSIT
jgi:hypothetical protein